MSDKIKEQMKIIKIEAIGTDIFSTWLQADKIVDEAKAGQFVSVYCNDGSRLLPRPISICEIAKETKQIRLVYRIAGKGTKELSMLAAGDTMEVMGPLGNGFPVERSVGKRALLIGGGIGVPPIVELAKAVNGGIRIVAGYRDELFLKEELEQYGKLTIATEDGSAGTKGNVLDAIRAEGLEADVIYACGPMPMLRALKGYAEEKQIECWLSLEERMACGIGACLACICKTKEVDEHSNVKNKRVCKEGPVFLSTEVEL